MDRSKGVKTRSRTISYSGCWTCRKRRIKCDEKATSCKKCEDANLTCAGYDVRLKWGTNFKDPTPVRGGSRMRINPGVREQRLMTEEELGSTLSVLDKEPTDGVAAGPFSVFRLEAPGQKGHDVPSLGTSERADSENDWTTPPEDDINAPQEDQEHTSGPLVRPIGPETLLLATEDLDLSHLGSLYVPTRSISDSDENTDEMLINDDFHLGSDDPSQPRRMDIAENEANLASEIIPTSGWSVPLTAPLHGLGNQQRQAFLDRLTQGSVGNDMINVQTMPLDIPNYRVPRFTYEGSPVTILIQHYAKHVTHLMQPLAHQNNPFRSLYLPLAIEECVGMGDSLESNDNIPARGAVFHSLVATAGLHLLGLGAKNQELEQLVCRHKQQALIALRYALSEKVSTYKELMMAVLSLVSVDIIDGGIHDHWIHLEAGFRLQTSRHHASLVSQETGQLNAICTMLRLFAQTAQPTSDPMPWTSDKPWFEPRTCDYSNSSIEYLYGITTAIARSIDKIYVAAQHISYYEGKTYPPHLMGACEALGDELHSWTIGSESFSTVNPEEKHILRVAHTQAKAFHYASLIYYYRSVQNCERDALNMEQEETLASMNGTEDLKDILFEPHDRPAPISWPAYIASCEAVGEHRNRWAQWWTRVQIYRLKSFSKQYKTIRQIWASLDRHNTSDWRKELDRMNIRILPV